MASFIDSILNVTITDAFKRYAFSNLDDVG
jgi:hypothetical protein